MTPQPHLLNLSARQRVTAAVVSVMRRIHPWCYDFTFSVAVLVLALDFIGLPLGLIALLLFIVGLCVVGKRVALPAHHRPSPHHSGVRKVAKLLIEGIAALTLALVVLIAVVVSLSWAHGATDEERAIEHSLEGKYDAGAEHISVADVLGERGGTVCLVYYGEKVGKDAPWAQEAFSRTRSLFFSRENYTILQLAHRSASGKVRYWEIDHRSFPLISPTYVLGAEQPKDLVGLLPQYCAPLASAVLVRTALKADSRPGYFLTDSAAPNQAAPTPSGSTSR
jgi:hypothetical protein